MRRYTLVGVAAILFVAVCGCSDETGPGSEIGNSKGGTGGDGGTAGSLSLVGGGGAGGMSGGASGAAQGGTSGAGGTTTNTAGKTSGGSGGSGTGGSKPVGTCKRVSGSDADCADFYEDKPQAYACDDTGAYVALNGAHGNNCASVNFVTGSKYGACCPP